MFLQLPTSEEIGPKSPRPQLHNHIGHECQAAHITCGRKPWFNASEKLFVLATVRRTHKILFSVLTPPDEIVHARIRKASTADCDTAVSVGTICEGGSLRISRSRGSEQAKRDRPWRAHSSWRGLQLRLAQKALIPNVIIFLKALSGQRSALSSILT